MSIIKHPITLAFLTAAIVFAVSYYYYNHYNNDSDDDSGKKKSKGDKKTKNKKKKIGINENTVVLSAIAGLIAWFVANSYFTEKSTKGSDGSDINTEDTSKIGPKDILKGELKGGGTGISLSKTDAIGPKVNNTNKIHRIESDDPTRSYNLLGSGLDIPRSELKIPNVLIDYH
jgi:hypothetical protein